MVIGLVDDADDFPQPRTEDRWIGQAVPIHDENGNQRMDTDFHGMPMEGSCFGNDAMRMGPPRFDEAAPSPSVRSPGTPCPRST